MLPRLFIHIHTRRLSLRQMNTSQAQAIKLQRPPSPPPTDKALNDQEDQEEPEDQDQYVDTSMGREWGGPMRGGRFPEPTRFGDWERKGRVTDF